MRPVVILVILLSVVCSPGVILHAQSCITADRYGGTTVTGTTCEYVYEEGGNRCERGDTVTFTPLLLSGPFTPATCPVQIKWDFGDGTKLTSSDPSVTHTYATTGEYYVQIDAPVQGGTSHNFHILIASGIISFPHGLSLDEGESATIAITRTGNLSRPGTVDYRTTGAVLPLNGTLSFGAGEAHKDLVIQAQDDTVSNGGDRSARLFLSNPTGDWIFDPDWYSEVGISVHDNDLPAIHQCTQTELHVNETAEVLTFELTRSQNTSGTTTGYVKVFGPNSSYYYFGYLHATFAPGETTRSVNLRWEDDSLYQGTRQWKFICGGEGPGVTSATSEGTIIVADNEPYPTLIAPASIEVTETDTPQLITIPISFVPQFGDWYDLDVVLEHETTGDADLKLLPFYYPYEKIELEIKGDDLPEPDETLYVRLIGAVQKWIPLTIRDDDRPPFPYAFDRESYEFDEALGGGSVVVQRTGSLAAPVQLLLRIHPSVPGAAVETIPVLFASGESSKEVPLALDDAWFTGTRHATMTLELDGFAGATASLIVKDNETIPSLSVGDASVREGNLNQFPSLEFLVTLTAPLGATLQLTLSPLHVSTDAADFRAVPQPLTIFPGELTATAEFLVNGDTEYESDETFNVTIGSCCDGLATVARQTGTATIVNDDGAPTQTLYRLALGATSFKEADRWLSIPVHRSGIVSGTTHAILKLTASDERVFAPRTVSFAPNETVNDVQFYINDFWYSGNTTVKVELFDGDRLLETKSVTILDDEAKPQTNVWSGSAREGNPRNAVPLTISVSPPSRKPIIVKLHSRSGGDLRNSAVLAEDFPLFDKTFEIPPGTYDYEVLIPIYNDQLRENTESFYVDVTIDGIASSYTNVYIFDDDTAYIEHESYVPRGTLTTISVHFPSPAPAKDTVYFQADPAILEGPQSVPVPVGARSVSFQVLAKRGGAFSFAVVPPTFLPPARLTGTINFFDEHTVTLAPAALELAPGTSARVVVSIGPGTSYFTTQSPDWTIAAIERTADADGKPSFLVYGISPGQTEILVKLPASVGGATARLPVVVKEPEKPGRKRATRH